MIMFDFENMNYIENDFEDSFYLDEEFSSNDLDELSVFLKRLKNLRKRFLVSIFIFMLRNFVSYRLSKIVSCNIMLVMLNV